jgi:Uncharacterised nucleotidyltransferase
MYRLFSRLRSGSTAQSPAARGRRVAQLLTGSWQQSPPAGAVSPQALDELTPLLLRAGAGGLAWCRVRHDAERLTPAAQHLQQAYRFQALAAALHEHHLKEAIPRLRRVGIEPVLVKGWAMSRLYPEPGMRPFSDLDLCVLPEHYRAASAALAGSESEAGNVDLHLGFGKFDRRQTDDMFARSQRVWLDDLEISVLSEEDHLLFLCLHLLRHGAVRPLWLCDIALMLEARAKDFDWDQCLGHSRQQADWVACAIGLAHQLLGANIEGTPIARRAKTLPGWLMPTVLKAWGTPFHSLGQLAVHLRHPVNQLGELLRVLPHHWPNPIEATMTLKGSFNELPRWPFQIGHVLSRAAALLTQLSRAAGAGSSEELMRS